MPPSARRILNQKDELVGFIIAQFFLPRTYVLVQFDSYERIDNERRKFEIYEMTWLEQKKKIPRRTELSQIERRWRGGKKKNKKTIRLKYTNASVTWVYSERKSR